MHSVLLTYKGFQIIVENYIYKLAINPTKHFLTMTDIKNEIDKIENNFEGIMNRIAKYRRDCTENSPHERSLKCQKPPQTEI